MGQPNKLFSFSFFHLLSRDVKLDLYYKTPAILLAKIFEYAKPRENRGQVSKLATLVKNFLPGLGHDRKGKSFRSASRPTSFNSLWVHQKYNRPNFQFVLVIFGCPERIELSTPDPQTGVLPLNYGHHVFETTNYTLAVPQLYQIYGWKV